MQHESMARPKRRKNEALANAVRSHMAGSGLSARTLAGRVGVQASTVTRSLEQSAFSDDLASRLRIELGIGKGSPRAAESLHKALHLLKQADRLYARAERMMVEAIDHIGGSK